MYNNLPVSVSDLAKYVLKQTRFLVNNEFMEWKKKEYLFSYNSNNGVCIINIFIYCELVFPFSIGDVRYCVVLVNKYLF